MRPSPPELEAPAPGAPWACALRRWYAAHRRALPWRDTPTPYRVWVSEIMLQQTQVSTAIPYFRRFVRALPSFRALAGTDLQSILKLWEGLGYYARARHLHRAAQQIAGPLRGRVPRTSAELRECPGIGEYTAAAIASICFGEAVPVVDGNVLRVFSRFLGIRTDPRAPGVRRRIAAFLAPRMPPDAAGDFNQALMEIGALVCRPQQPACARCPLSPWCEARRKNLTARIPAKRARRPVPHRHAAAAIVRVGSRVLVVRRPAAGLLGGLWEFPTEERLPAEPLEQAAARAAAKHLNAAVDVARQWTLLRHTYSHFTLTLHAFPCRPAAARVRARPGTAAKFVSLKTLDDLPMSAVHRRLAGMLPPAAE